MKVSELLKEIVQGLYEVPGMDNAPAFIDLAADDLPDIKIEVAHQPVHPLRLKIDKVVFHDDRLHIVCSQHPDDGKSLYANPALWNDDV